MHFIISVWWLGWMQIYTSGGGISEALQPPQSCNLQHLSQEGENRFDYTKPSFRTDFFLSSSHEMWKLLVFECFGNYTPWNNRPSVQRRWKFGDRMSKIANAFIQQDFHSRLIAISQRSKSARPIANIKSTFDSFASGPTLSKSPRQKSQVLEPASAALLSWSVHRLDLEAYAGDAAPLESYKLCLTWWVTTNTNLCCQTYESELEDQVISGLWSWSHLAWLVCRQSNCDRASS